MDNPKRMISLYTTQFENGIEVPNTDEELDMYWEGYNELKRRGYLKIMQGIYVGITESEKDYWEAIIQESDGYANYIHLELVPCLHVC